MKTKKERDPNKDKGHVSAIHGDYRRYLGVNISILNQPTTPLHPKYKYKSYKYKYKSYTNTNTNISRRKHQYSQPTYHSFAPKI